MTKHLFIINPAAGVRSSVNLLTKKIENAFLNLTSSETSYEIVVTTAKGDANRIARKQAEKNSGQLRIYACGGDGTLNEVVNAVVGFQNVAIASIPVGSGNDFIKSFESIPRECFSDIAASVSGEVICCDVLKLDDKFCLNVASVGLDAVTAKLQSTFKRIPGVSGPFAYKLALGVAFLNSMKNKISFEIDGKPFTFGNGSVTLAVAGNGRFYGGGFKATPYAEVNDGLIDFICAKSVSRSTFLKYVSVYKSGNHIGKMPFIKYLTCKKIKILSATPIPVQFDGEFLNLRNPEVSIQPGAISFILPKMN